MKRLLGVCFVLAAFDLVSLPAAGAGAADLPKATRVILKQTGLPENLLQGVDEELKVPPGWIEKARKEDRYVSGSRTKLTIAGKKESRSTLKQGMTCKITMAEGAKEAQELSCR